MLRFWKYGLYVFLRFALFKEKNGVGEGKASILPSRGKRANQNWWRVKLK